MKVEDVMRCSFSTWYETFEDVTLKSIILPIPKEFLDYLHADSVVLPEGSHQGAYSSSIPDDSEDEEAVDWTSSADCKEAKMPDCAGFLQQVDTAIRQLGGTVFPKLNWSSPQDASWVSLNNSLQCCHASDVCLLLKSSNFIAHDLSQPFIHCEDRELASKDVVIQHDLVLRRWADINNSHEFRCFVRHGKLIGICPRNHSKFFQHIVDSRPEIQEDIEEFFEEVVDGNFTMEPGSYTFDVWRRKKNEVVLIDFNPYGPVTDALLFDWNELTAYNESDGLTFRIVESENGVQPSILSQFGMPTDFVDLATGQDPFKLMDLMKLGQLQGQDDSSSSEEEEDRNGEAWTDCATDR
ncbi:translation initiation factor eIF2 assembly protein-like isoform X1 [Babylonia areolata]|uniref:translation initiation factor eIF2 assembly protein-like isoform X1 n=1 Tax=Babylonia areolata TaxID=304850 RepID=UPI003FCFB4E6